MYVVESHVVYIISSKWHVLQHSRPVRACPSSGESEREVRPKLAARSGKECRKRSATTKPSLSLPLMESMDRVDQLAAASCRVALHESATTQYSTVQRSKTKPRDACIVLLVELASCYSFMCQWHESLPIRWSGTAVSLTSSQACYNMRSMQLRLYR
jgi:hypothetical protein